MTCNIVSFQNAGLIDPRCITTIGVSVKETDNPIGFFGTGLKYAIAIILRNGGTIRVWRGRELLAFDRRTIVVRQKPVDIVCMNGVELGFTTELGKQWEVWQAFRELWCNTQDEGGIAHEGTLAYTDEHTTIEVELAEFADCFRNIERYILRSPPVHVGKHVTFHGGPAPTVFYRSIRVYQRPDRPHLFPPNVHDQLTLTEDRTVKEWWEVQVAIAKAIASCDNEAFLERWLTTGDEYAEHTLDLDWSGIQPSDAFLNVVARLARDPSRPLNLTAVKVMCKYVKLPELVPAELLDFEAASLAKAIAFCSALKYPVDEFPITVVESLGPNVLGRAQVDGRRIYIARRAMQLGDLTLASTLIEEWVHLKHGFNDTTRDLQNWLFDQVARLGQAYLHERAKHPMAEAA